MIDSPLSDLTGAASAQPLPARPGAMAAQPKGTRRSVTAGRPLPARAGEAATAFSPVAAAPPAPLAAPAALAPLAVAAPPAPPVIAAPRATEGGRPSRPDPRSMRIALGAGAVAAVSVFGAGMIKPDWGAEPDAAVATEADQALASEPSTDANRRPRVRRVTEYVFLQPGEKAPRGAKVISSERLLGVTTPDAPSNARADEPRTPRTNRPNAPANEPRNPAPQADRPKADRPQPEREEPPRVTTRQSS